MKKKIKKKKNKESLKQDNPAWGFTKNFLVYFMSLYCPAV